MLNNCFRRASLFAWPRIKSMQYCISSLHALFGCESDFAKTGIDRGKWKWDEENFHPDEVQMGG